MIYLDASVIVAAITSEATAEPIRRWIESRPAGALAASDWTLLETTSALSIKRRTGALTDRLHRATLGDLQRLAAEHLHVIPPIAADFDHARTWVAMPSLGLRGGDALHLAIAHRMHLALATFDRLMAEVALLAGISLAQLPAR